MVRFVERLQKILSHAGVASRRASEQLMLEGRVTVNGATIRELGTKADPAHDDIRVDGRRVKLPDRHRYLLLNKPRGYLTTRSDPQKRPTVIDLIGIREYLYPVGRLDFESEGLLLLTNDGDLAARLTHPRHGVPRVYEVRVAGVPDAHDLQRLARGVIIDGRRTTPVEVTLRPSASLRSVGPSALRPAQGRPERSRGAASSGSSRARARDDKLRGAPSRAEELPALRSTLLITVREGRNRQVRNMCDAIGHPVDHLKRVAIGPLRDAHLKVGQWRDLTADEVKKLRKAADAPVSKAQKLYHGGHGKERRTPKQPKGRL